MEKSKSKRTRTASDWSLLFISGLTLIGCASQIREKPAGAPPAPVNSVDAAAFTGLKHRIAIAKFEDKTGYGQNLFGVVDDIGSQASDILNSHLIKTGEFIILERENLKDLQNENQLQKVESQFANVTAMIFGSVTEMGTKTEWVDHGLSKTKVQTAHAKVTIRLVDPLTGHAFYSEFGEADAQNEASQTLGFGGKAGYDATLTDKALNGAITKLVGNILNSLRALPWKAPIVDVQEGNVFIGAGKSTNIKPGQILSVQKPGKKVLNKATNVMMQLPGTVVGKVKVESFFGQSALDEGAIGSVVEKSEPITVDMEIVEVKQ